MWSVNGQAISGKPDYLRECPCIFHKGADLIERRLVRVLENHLTSISTCTLEQRFLNAPQCDHWPYPSFYGTSSPSAAQTQASRHRLEAVQTATHLGPFLGLANSALKPCDAWRISGEIHHFQGQRCMPPILYISIGKWWEPRRWKGG